MSLHGRAASGDWSVFAPLFFLFDLVENSNFSMNAPAQFQYIPGGRRPSLKLHMDEILRFWVEVACENLQSSGANLTKRQLLAQILQQYERRGDAMRYLNEQGKIAWKASPRFLMMLADAERDARDDLADWP